MEEFNLIDFLKYYLSKVWMVIILIVVGFLFSFYYTSELQVPMYQSNTSLVLTRANDTNSITQSDISLNKNLVSTYREIIKSRRILTKVIDQLKLDMTSAELGKQITVSNADNTELIIISVKDQNKKQAMKIANKIAQIFQQEIPDIYNIENVSIIDEAEKAEEPYNVHVTKQYLLGSVGGFLLGSLLLMILFYFDDTIKATSDIEDKVNLPVLATVPKYKKKGEKK